MIGILLSTLKGSNSYKNMEKNIILESSWKYASGLLHISLCTNKLTTVPITESYSKSLSFPLLLHGMGTILSSVREITPIKNV
jgi:hypothetical protein